MERLVFDQVDRPNHAAWVHALVDAGWDEAAADAKPLDQIQVTMTPQHLAHGLGLRFAEFQAVLRRVRLKIAKYLKTGTIPCRQYDVQLCKLEGFFGVPTTPAHLPPKVVRHLMLFTASEHREKLTPEVVQLLRDIGVKPREIAVLSKGIVRDRANYPQV